MAPLTVRRHDRRLEHRAPSDTEDLRPMRPLGRGNETVMNESTHDEAALAHQALQESMDLRDQGHSDD